MAKYKLYTEEEEKEFNKTDIQIIAIHTSLEDYRLAFFLNKLLHINLIKDNAEVTVKNKDVNAFFLNFIFEDKLNDAYWNLIQNINEVNQKKLNFSQDLFTVSDTSFQTKVYLLPEHKKIDYLLKIEDATEIYDLDEIITKINSIERVNAVYELDFENLKSKNNLIF